MHMTTDEWSYTISNVRFSYTIFCVWGVSACLIGPFWNFVKLLRYKPTIIYRFCCCINMKNWQQCMNMKNWEWNMKNWQQNLET